MLPDDPKGDIIAVWCLTNAEALKFLKKLVLSQWPLDDTCANRMKITGQLSYLSY
jgi:hypothetical protein